MAMRLQLGAGRFEDVDPRIVEIFADKSWVHLGDRAAHPKPLLEKLKGKSPGFLCRIAIDKMKKLERRRSSTPLSADPYSLTDFRPFEYSAGDSLPFASESFDFVYSEHFFEHLFLDEAVALLKECERVMRPGAVIRTCVPDAELKTHEKPEFAGFPDRKMSFTHPLKHKNRWTVYSLTEILRLIGFHPTPLTYYTKTGEFVTDDPQTANYPGNPDQWATQTMDYVARRNSLIVDGQKPRHSF